MSDAGRSSLGGAPSDSSAAAPVAAVPATGALVARRYRVDGVLGRGAMGVVLAVTHVALGKKLAIKMLAPDIAQDATMRERFEREALAVSVLRGRHIVRTLDVDVTDDGIPFLVMERLKGRDLLRACGPVGTTPLPRIVDWLIQVCSAMHEPHSIGIVHRDLKPSNILVTQPSGIVKVLDFGVSKIMSAADLTVTRSSIGTPRYMAPEQLRGDAVDPRADVWAIGTITYRLLAGRFPFDGAEGVPGEIAAIRALIEDAIDIRRFVPDLPDPLAAAVMRCLEREPDERMGSVAELASALAPFGSGEVVFERVPEADSDSQIGDLRSALADSHGLARADRASSPHGPADPHVDGGTFDTAIDTPRPFSVRRESGEGPDLDETASEAEALRARSRRARASRIVAATIAVGLSVAVAAGVRAGGGSADDRADRSAASRASTAGAVVGQSIPGASATPQSDESAPSPSARSEEPQEPAKPVGRSKERPRSKPVVPRGSSAPPNKAAAGEPLHL